jgi:predicted metal-binding membrane protein
MSHTGDVKRSGAERTVVLAALGLLAALCWAYLLLRIGRLAPLGAAAAGQAAPIPYHGADLARMFALWVVVIAAMMLPAAAPSVLLYARIRQEKHRDDEGERRGARAYEAAAKGAGQGAAPKTVRVHGEAPQRRHAHFATASYAGIGAFSAGYLIVWSACAAVATVAGWLLHDAGLLDETLAVAHPSAVALALAGAGVYQWTPAKHWYLDNCREPLAVLLTHWRRGAWGALRMGMADARYGMGCCWLLLAVVLPAGVLNLPVIGGLIALILAEKLLPGGHILACATGLGLVAWGTTLLFP